MQYTLIVPTFNEAENLPRLVSALFDLALPDFYLIIVDDASPDGTGQLADTLAKEHTGRLQVIHRTSKQGLGTAYISGFKLALKNGADAIGQMDADFSHPLKKIPALLAALDSADVVIGSRYVKGGSLDERWPLWRKALSAFGNSYARTILKLPIRDVTGGFRIWRRDTLQGMPLDSIRSTGYAFQVETAYVAYRLGNRFTEIPIHFADRRWGVSKMSLRIQMEAAMRVWQTRWRYRHLALSERE